MATSTIKANPFPSENVRVVSLGTDSSTNGYHISFPETVNFAIIFAGTATGANVCGCLFKRNGANAVIAMMSGTLVSQSATATDIYMRVGAWGRFMFIINASTATALNQISIETYSA